MYRPFGRYTLSEPSIPENFEMGCLYPKMTAICKVPSYRNGMARGVFYMTPKTYIGIRW
jgi:hypothetical protein